MGRMKDVWIDQEETIRLAEDNERDAAYDEWLSSLADMEDERRCRVPHAGGTLRLPEQQAATQQLKRGLTASIKRWQREPAPAWTWPEGGSMTSDEDFTPETLG